MEVIPAINCPDFACAKERIKLAEQFADWIHVDVVDGKFAPPITWGDPNEFASLKTPLKLEVHLMVEDPEGAVDSWLRAGAKRAIVHLESIKDPIYVIQKCERFKAEAFLGLNPGTEVERALAHAEDFRGFLILAVFPGYSGQPFQESALQKIRRLKEASPRAILEVDGGINDKTAPRVKAAGADIVVAASYIFGSTNPQDAYRKLRA
jgi:ribulose-phosphate 3-epimerase